MEYQNTHFVFSKFFSESRAGYEKMWKNIATDGSIVGRMRVAYWITKATGTH
jgi:hypothetical protein